MENILITGISKGLGFVMTKRALAKGFKVFGICRSIDQHLLQLKESYPDHLHILQFDLINHKDLKEKVFQEFIGDTPLSALINNAAISYETLVTNMDADEVIAMTMVNQIVPMLLTKYAIRNMILHDIKGSIVHLTSISAHTGFKGLAMYAATKGAMEAFSKSASREWGGKGIRSNCIAAGFMNTQMTKDTNPEVKEKIYKRASLKQATSDVSVADTALFLISPSSGSITGQVIHVDAGII